MTNIQLPKESTGQKLIEVIKTISGEIDFEYYDKDGEISIQRSFPEFVPEHKKCALDVTPRLFFEFGKINPNTNYQTLECETSSGIMFSEPTDFKGEYQKYKPHYDRFIQRLNELLK